MLHMNHIVLLGDSIFDNAAYSGEGRDVCSQLRQRLSSDGKVTLLAVDGSMAQDMTTQINQIPVDTTHIVVSVGGNDALNSMGLLDAKVHSVAEVLNLVATVLAGFSQHYRSMLTTILDQRYQLALSTIYYPRLPDSELQQVAITALAFFNDLIIAEAIQNRLPLLDLRFICNEDTDYANPIEPSASGGAKIGAAIQRLLLEHDFSQARTEIFV